MSAKPDATKSAVADMSPSPVAPRVTVLMSVYNAERFVARAVESILGQTFADFEFLIIDDGSTDGSKAIVESFDDPRIRFVSRANIGLTPSLNEGIALSRGEYIARQDADDVSLPDRLEREVAYLDSHADVALVGSNYTLVDERDQPIVTTDVFTHPDDLAVAQLLANQFGHGSVMFRRSVIDEAGAYDEGLDLVSDYELFCRIARVAKLANLTEPAYLYRSSADGLSLSNQPVQNALAHKIRDREFERQVLGARRRLALLTSFHPRSLRVGPLRYLDKKSTLFRDLAWLYRAHGRRGATLGMLAMATLHAPWRRRNYRNLWNVIVRPPTGHLWEYELL